MTTMCIVPMVVDAVDIRHCRHGIWTVGAIWQLWPWA